MYYDKDLNIYLCVIAFITNLLILDFIIMSVNLNQFTSP